MSKKIFICGHKGMVGSALHRRLIDTNDEVIVADRSALDLTVQSKVIQFFSDNKFDEVYMAAAKVGGIKANSDYPADFITQNLIVQNNVFDGCFKSGVTKLLFLGSSCVYPKLSEQPLNAL